MTRPRLSGVISWHHLPLDAQLAALNAGLINGCGTPRIRVPNLSFWEACAAHDFAYWVGGRPHHRIRADFAFLRDMLGAARTPLESGVAVVYFLAVYAFGDTAWIARHRPLSPAGILRGLRSLHPRFTPTPAVIAAIRTKGVASWGK
jgi:hypothetical protein